MARKSNERPPLVVAMKLAHQVTSISMELVIPAALGYWLDTKWGTEPWLLVAGAMLGFALFMTHILQLSKKFGGSNHRDRKQ